MLGLRKHEREHLRAVRREQTKRVVSSSFLLVAVVLAQVAIGYGLARLVF